MDIGAAILHCTEWLDTQMPQSLRCINNSCCTVVIIQWQPSWC